MSVVTVGACGLAASSVVAIRSERVCSETSRAACTASAAIEEVRAASLRGDWARVVPEFDRAEFLVEGAANGAVDRMVVSVAERSTASASAAESAGSAGASPGFFLVSVGAAVAGAGAGSGARMQTYVADRRPVPREGDAGVPAWDARPDGLVITLVRSLADRADTTLSNVVAAGNGTRVTAFDIRNASGDELRIARVTLTLPSGNAAKRLRLGRSTVFSDAKSTAASVTRSWSGSSGPLLLPGDTEVRVTHVGAALGEASPGAISLTFVDGSVRTWEIRP